jgi:hypothetical protein
VLTLICLHVAWFTWIHQALGTGFFEGTGAQVIAAIALLDAGIVALSERFTSGREREVIAHTAAFFGLALLVPFGVLLVLGDLPRTALPGLLLLFASLVAIWLIYRSRRPDIGMLAAFASVVTLLISAVFARILLDELDADLVGVTALGVIVCAQVWGFTRWLLAWRREHEPAQTPAQTGGER